jgi:hypothetical protein
MRELLFSLDFHTWGYWDSATIATISTKKFNDSRKPLEMNWFDGQKNW